jgi:hypothetical protein
MNEQEVIAEVKRITSRYGGAVLSIGNRAFLYTDCVWELEQGVLAVERKGWRIATVDVHDDLHVSEIPKGFLDQDYRGHFHSYDEI